MSGQHAVCAVEDVPHESAREFQVGDQSVVVVRFDGQFHAYLNWCPHLGIELNFMPDQFMDDDGRFLVCANHGALFEPENGHCLSGPCSGEALTAVPLEVRDDTVWVGPVGSAGVNQGGGGHHPFDDLTPDVILDAVDGAGFVTDGRLLALNSFENRVYQVGLEEAEPVVTKFYRPARWSDAQILEEHAFSRFLRDQDLPVVAPLANAAGDTLFVHAGFRFAVFPRQGGHAPELDNDDHLRLLGRTLARWHAAGNDRPFQARPVLDMVADSRAAADYINNGVVDPNFAGRYRELSAALLEAMTERLRDQSWTAINVHGDCHTGNILWRDDKPHFVDLDDSLRGPAMQDLWMLLSGDHLENQQQLRVLAEGYETFLPFPWAQRRLIEPLRTRRILRHSAWLAERWDDPAFPPAFPWFESPRYWQDHLNDLEQQLDALTREDRG